MASTKLFLALTLISFFAISTVKSATPAQSPTPAVDCSSLILNMADCLSYVSNGSTTVKPEASCCSGLKTVLKANPDCLCVAFKSSAQFGVVLNITKASGLPAACHVSAPSITTCGLSPAGAGGSPVASPASSPMPFNSAPGPSVETNEQTPAPAPAPAKAGGAIPSASIASLVLALVIASLSMM